MMLLTAPLSAFSFEPKFTNYFSNPQYDVKSLKYRHHEYFIPYKISGSNLQYFELNCEGMELLIYLHESESGNMTLNMPRKMLDSKLAPGGSQAKDDIYFMLVDGRELLYKEIDSDTDSRTLQFSFPDNSKVIQIIASFLPVSQFGLICGMGDLNQSPYYRLLSPLQQFKSGIPVEAIQCKVDLITILKKNGTPACVTPLTGEKLIERQWATFDISENTQPKPG